MARDVEAVRRRILCPNSSSYDIRHVELTTIFTTRRSDPFLHSWTQAKKRRRVANRNRKYGDTSLRQRGTSMIETTTRRHTGATTMIVVLTALYAVTFLLGALLHLGVRIPLGFTVLAEPRIVPATIVEGLCSLFLAGGAYATVARRAWVWSAVTAAYAFALGGVLLGMAALAMGPGPSTELNTIYHRAT